MAEEMIDFGFSAVTADEYEKDNTDGENTGSEGVVVDVKVFNRHGVEKDERSIAIERNEIDMIQEDEIW